MLKYALSLFIFAGMFLSTACAASKSAQVVSLEKQLKIPESEQPFSIKERAPVLPEAGEKSIGPQIGVTVIWLLFIIVLIYALAYAFKKIAPVKSGLTTNDAIEVLCKQYIDPKQKLAVIKVHNRVLILGVGTNGITKISEFTEKEDLDFFTSTFSLGKDNLFSRMMNKEQLKIDDDDEDSFDKKLHQIRDSLTDNNV